MTISAKCPSRRVGVNVLDDSVSSTVFAIGKRCSCIRSSAARISVPPDALGETSEKLYERQEVNNEETSRINGFTGLPNLQKQPKAAVRSPPTESNFSGATRISPNLRPGGKSISAKGLHRNDRSSVRVQHQHR